MKHKTNLVVTIFSLIFFLAGISLLVTGLAVEKKYATISIIGTVLMVLSLCLSLLIFFIRKETVDTVEVKKDATAICPHCGKENPNDIPYCTHCGCRLK